MAEPGYRRLPNGKLGYFDGTSTREVDPAGFDVPAHIREKINAAVNSAVDKFGTAADKAIIGKDPIPTQASAGETALDMVKVAPGGATLGLAERAIPALGEAAREARDRSPIATALAEMAAGAATPIPGAAELGAAKNLPGIAKVGLRAGQAAAEGAAYAQNTTAPGTEADTAGAAEAAGATSLALQAAGGLGRLVPGARQLRRGAQQARFAHAGMTTEGSFARLGGREAELARQQALGLNTGLQSRSEMQDLAERLNAERGASRAQIEAANPNAQVDPRRVVQNLEAEAQGHAPVSGSPRQAIRHSAAKLDNMRRNPTLADSLPNTFGGWSAMRSQAGQNARFDRNRPANVSAAAGAEHAAINDAQQAALDALAPGAGADWRKLGQEQGTAIRTADNLGAVMREGELLPSNASTGAKLASALRSPTAGAAVGGVLGSAGGLPGAVAGAALGGGVNQYLRGREHAVSAVLQETGAKVSDWVTENPVARTLRKAQQAAQAGVPIGNTGYRMPLRGNMTPAQVAGAREGADAVQKAQDENGPVAAAAAHYNESLTNPGYHSAQRADGEE